jgi:hypothetical protein
MRSTGLRWQRKQQKQKRNPQTIDQSANNQIGQVQVILIGLAVGVTQEIQVSRRNSHKAEQKAQKSNARDRFGEFLFKKN